MILVSLDPMETLDCLVFQDALVTKETRAHLVSLVLDHLDQRDCLASKERRACLDFQEKQEILVDLVCYDFLN